MKNTVKLWEKSRYTSPIGCILNSRIVEYDIRKANISILSDYGILSESDYETFFRMDGYNRKVAVGKMQLKNKEYSNILKEGLNASRKELFKFFNLDLHNIIAIHNDAIIFISDGSDIGVDEFKIGHHTSFIKKNLYSSYYRLSNCEFFYDFNPTNSLEVLEVKGLGEEAISLHRDYFLQLLNEIFYMANVYGVKYALQNMKTIYNAYKNLSYSLEYYRRLDTRSEYEFLNISEYGKYFAKDLFSRNKKALNINFNLNILQELSGYYAKFICKKLK